MRWLPDGEACLEDAWGAGASYLYELPVRMGGSCCLLPEEPRCSRSCTLQQVWAQQMVHADCSAAHHA